MTQFKNYAHQAFTFHPGFNLLYGTNGSGKTNVLDAIHYLALGKSHFVPQDKFAIRQGETFFRIEGVFKKEEEAVQFVLKFQPGSKRLEKDGKAYARMQDHIGEIGLVMIAPDDLDLIDGLSQARRKFIDLTLSQSDKIYLGLLATYKRLLDQRNALLKTSQAPDRGLLQVLNEKMTEPAHRIYALRKKFVTDFLPFFYKYYHAISGGKENVEFRFQSDLDQADLLTLFSQSLQQDLYTQFTVRGCHKDDLVFLKDGEPLKYIGSQGQKKTFLVSLFLAQSDYLSKTMHDPPIILLDDIFDKLDDERIRFLLHTIGNMPTRQVIITDTGRDRLSAALKDLGSSVHFIHIRDGLVTTHVES